MTGVLYQVVSALFAGPSLRQESVNREWFLMETVQKFFSSGLRSRVILKVMEINEITKWNVLKTP